VILIITNVIAYHYSITFVKTFAERLRYARRFRGLKQKQLARLAGLSQSAVSNYETQQRYSSRQLIQLSNALDINPLWLAEGVEPMENQSVSGRAHTQEPLPTQGKKLNDWPFPRISPQDFYTLPLHQRMTLEEVALSWLQQQQAAAEKPD